MIHPATEVRLAGQNKGYGLYARGALPIGTIICVTDDFDRVIPNRVSATRFGPLREKLLTYCYRDHQGNLILNWDEARYVNHCCHANTLLTAYGFEIVVRDIAEDDEITTDYGLLNIVEGYPVACLSAECRKAVAPLDQWEPEALQRQIIEWDTLIEYALRSLERTPQELSGLLSRATKQRLEAYLECAEDYASVSGILNWKSS